MIYVSSACSKKKNIRESVLELVDVGFKNIELSGGSEYNKTIEKDLKELQAKYNLNFLLHNYFPPPQLHFVLNLASTDKNVQQKSTSFILNAVQLSEELNAKKYGFHGGFFIDPIVNELGKKIEKQQIFKSETGIANFIKNFETLNSNKTEVKLYIENNVLSFENYRNFECNPFMLTHAETYIELQKQIKFNLLLDVAHLKVSCNSLEIDFLKELKYLSSKTDYLHLSDNDGISDLNKEILKDSALLEMLSECDLRNKTISLEIYSGLDKVEKSFELIEPFVKQ